MQHSLSFFMVYDVVQVIRVTLFLALVLSAAEIARSQDTTATADTLRIPRWETALTGKLVASQAGYQNWTEGGINTIATAASINGKSVFTSRRWVQTYESRFAIGVVKQDTLNFRKAEDVIRVSLRPASIMKRTRSEMGACRR
jgi:hypothetical protein